MKKLACIMFSLLFFPLWVLAQTPPENTISSYRIWVKDGHDAALDKALAEHAKMYHTGHWKWRVFQVLSGPDGGSYQITEGPNSWTTLDSRADISAEHTKHYDSKLTPHIEKSSPQSYLTYDEKLSTTGLANFSSKATITHIYLKPGRTKAYMAALASYKAVWEKQGRNVVVYRSFSSGPPQLVIVGRLKNGFKDFDADNSVMSDVFDSVNGAGSYDKYLEEVSRDVESMVGEMIEFKPELSSPK